MTIVCYERQKVCKKKFVGLKDVVTNKYLLWEKDNILNLLEKESVWKNKNILVD